MNDQERRIGIGTLLLIVDILLSIISIFIFWWFLIIGIILIIISLVFFILSIGTNNKGSNQWSNTESNNKTNNALDNFGNRPHLNTIIQKTNLGEIAILTPEVIIVKVESLNPFSKGKIKVLNTFPNYANIVSKDNNEFEGYVVITYVINL